MAGTFKKSEIGMVHWYKVDIATLQLKLIIFGIVDPL